MVLHCFVTGASGYLGSALCSKLLAEDIEVSGQFYQGKVPLATRTVQLDLRAGVAKQNLRDVDAVFHLAGIAHQHADTAAYEAVNVEATIALARAAKEAGVRQFVFISSVLAARATDHLKSARGADSLTAKASPYALSKAKAEEALKALLHGSTTALHIVRPALIYSAEAPGHLGWLRRWARLRLPAPPDLGGRSMIARADLVNLLLVLTKVGSRHAPTIVASDGEVYSSRRIYQAFANASKVSPPIKQLPDTVWKLGCRAMDVARMQEAGQFWQRMSSRELYCPYGMEELGFRPLQTLETDLGLDH